MKISLKFIALVIFGLVSCVILPGSARAQGSVTVEPAYITTSISTANPDRTEVITVRNNYARPVRLTAIPYGVDKQSGRVSATETLDEALEDAIVISDTDFTLEPEQSISLKLLIQNSDKLAPGGHYAAILIKQIDENGKDMGLQQALGISLYIIKEDGAIRSLSLDVPASPKLTFTLPRQLDLLFNNTGNVVVIPRASTAISSGEKTLSTGAVNEGSVPVAPEDQLETSANLTQLSSLWLPAKITQQVTYRYDGQDQTQTITQTFWYIPWQIVLLVFVLITICYWQRKRLIGLTRKKIRKPKAEEKAEEELKNQPKVIINDIKPKAKTKTKTKTSKKKSLKIEVK